MTKAIAILMCAVVLMSMYTVQVMSVHNEQVGGAVCRDTFDALGRVAYCVKNGSMTRQPNGRCCSDIKTLSIGCFCDIFISSNSVYLIDHYIRRCHMRLPRFFKC